MVAEKGIGRRVAAAEGAEDFGRVCAAAAREYGVAEPSAGGAHFLLVAESTLLKGREGVRT